MIYTVVRKCPRVGPVQELEEEEQQQWQEIRMLTQLSIGAK